MNFSFNQKKIQMIISLASTSLILCTFYKRNIYYFSNQLHRLCTYIECLFICKRSLKIITFIRTWKKTGNFLWHNFIFYHFLYLSIIFIIWNFASYFQGQNPLWQYKFTIVLSHINSENCYVDYATDFSMTSKTCSYVKFYIMQLICFDYWKIVWQILRGFNS